MPKDSFERWEPLPAIPRDLYVESISDTDAGLVLLLSIEDSRRPVLRITFEAYVAYRNINESYRLRLWHRDASVGAGLFVVADSSWRDWLREESKGLLDALATIHYAIYTTEDCVDVVAQRPPTVEWITQT